MQNRVLNTPPKGFIRRWGQPLYKGQKLLYLGGSTYLDTVLKGMWHYIGLILELLLKMELYCILSLWPFCFCSIFSNICRFSPYLLPHYMSYRSGVASMRYWSCVSHSVSSFRLWEEKSLCFRQKNKRLSTAYLWYKFCNFCDKYYWRQIFCTGLWEAVITFV